MDEGWSQPVDATPTLNSADDEKCRQGLTAAEKPELWHRWQPGIVKAIRRVFGKRYAGVASTRLSRQGYSGHGPIGAGCPLLTHFDSGWVWVWIAATQMKAVPIPPIEIL